MPLQLPQAGPSITVVIPSFGYNMKKRYFPSFQHQNFLVDLGWRMDVFWRIFLAAIRMDQNYGLIPTTVVFCLI